jgi:aspartokinase
MALKSKKVKNTSNSVLTVQTGNSINVTSSGTLVTSGTTTVNSPWYISSGSTTNVLYSISKASYNVLGKEIEVEGANKDFNVALCLALINTNGLEFYIELKKQEISFPNEIGEYLESELVKYLRDKKIEEVIK